MGEKARRALPERRRAATPEICDTGISTDLGSETAMSFDWSRRITFDPAQCGGRPCIRHYRLRVSDVLDMLAGGATPEDILSDYEFLEAEDIRACLEYASAQIDHPVLIGAA
ncbi:MAG: DUF433 domain-containing protein [Caulobacteraceae bacterium]